MSSLKRAAKVGQRMHRERSQPESRAHLGFLEKKKDYVLRAGDFNKKKKKLQRLRRRALDKNPDEFHFHMVRSQIKEDGTHHDMLPEPDEDTALQKKLSNVKDLKYVRHCLNLEKQKIEKLKANLHFADLSVAKNTHTVFVDTDEEAKRFDPVKYFDTKPELLDRTFNRPSVSTLEEKAQLQRVSKTDVVDADRDRQAQYNELLKRMERARELQVVVEKLEVRKSIADSKKKQMKPKKVVKGEPMKARVFEWTYERKK